MIYSGCYRYFNMIFSYILIYIRGELIVLLLIQHPDISFPHSCINLVTVSEQRPELIQPVHA